MTTSVSKPGGKIIYRLRVQTTNDASLIRRLRMALKVLWRQFGLRVLEIQEEQTP
jgi:hypothetical protein